MAYSVEQSPTTTVVHSTQYPIVFRLKDSAYTAAKYRYVAEVTIDGAVRAVIKLPPNAAGTATIDLSRVCDDFLAYCVDGLNNDSVHQIDPDGVLAQSGQTPIRQATVRVGKSVAASANVAPTISYVSTHYFLFALFAGEQSHNTRSTTTYLRNLEIANWQMDAITKSALTEAPYHTGLTSGDAASTRYFINYATLNDYAVLSAWYASNSGGNRDVDSDWDNIVVRGVKKDGSVITDTIDVETSIGVAATAVNTDEKMWVNIGVGPRNFTSWLTGTNLKVALAADNVAHYDVTFMNGLTTVSGKHRYYIQDNDCYNGLPVRLAWVNRAGGWDYYSFRKKRVVNMEVTRQQFEQDAGNWNEDAAYVRNTGYTGGKTNHRVSNTQVVEINTDWIKEEDNRLIESLVTSPLIHRIDQDENITLQTTIENVQIRQTSYVEKTSRNDKLIRYAFTIESSKKNVVR